MKKQFKRATRNAKQSTVYWYQYPDEQPQELVRDGKFWYFQVRGGGEVGADCLEGALSDLINSYKATVWKVFKGGATAFLSGGETRKADFVIDDGGRAKAGFKGDAGDCVTRAVSIATGLPYKRVYNDLTKRLREHAQSHTRRDRIRKRFDAGQTRSANEGMPRKIFEPYLLKKGWVFVPVMGIGTGCTMHLRHDELPKGRIICRVSKHLVAAIDGVIHDTYDCSRDGTRCVYGYFHKPETKKGGKK